MNKYRDLYLKDINKNLVGRTITVSGWVNRSRDHGNLLFIDLRDSTSLLQCVVDNSSPIFENFERRGSFGSKNLDSSTNFKCSLNGFSKCCFI